MDKVYHNLYDALTECGLAITYGQFSILSEEAKLNMTDETMTEMFKFVSDKYNSIDFSEIEKSKGDILAFKYCKLIDDNINLLSKIYHDTDTDVYTIYIQSMIKVMEHLKAEREKYMMLFHNGNGVAQILYVTQVTDLIYCISTLIDATIKFTSIDNTSEIEVVVDELSNHSKYVYLKNMVILGSTCSRGDMSKVLDAMMTAEKNRNRNEMIELSLMSPTLLPFLLVPVVFLVLVKLIPVIREVIYTVFYTRVKISEALDTQINLIKTNIESLEGKTNKKKVIAKQKAIVKLLEGTRNVMMVKFEKAEIMAKADIKKEDAGLHIDTTQQAKNYDVLI